MKRIIFPIINNSKKYYKQINATIKDINPYLSERKNLEYEFKTGHSNLKSHSYINYGLSRKERNKKISDCPEDYKNFLLGNEKIKK